MCALDAEGRERDRLGRLVPQRVSWLMLHRAVGVLSRFKEVPASYYQRGSDQAVVSCPCGDLPVVTDGESVQCQCERIYLLAGNLWVANSPRAATSVAVD